MSPTAASLSTIADEEHGLSLVIVMFVVTPVTIFTPDEPELS